jgi:hypothetical protein
MCVRCPLDYVSAAYLRQCERCFTIDGVSLGVMRGMGAGSVCRQSHINGSVTNMAQNQKQQTRGVEGEIEHRERETAAAAEAAKPAPQRVSSNDVAQIIKTPERYGFRWVSHPLSTDSGATRLRDADTATEITDLALFRACFGDDNVKAWLNGASSLKVQEDTVCRKMRIANATVSEQEQRENVVRRVLLGVAAPRGGVKIVTVEVVKYGPAMDGNMYGTLLEVQQVNIAALTEMGMSVSEAKARLNIGE